MKKLLFLVALILFVCSLSFGIGLPVEKDQSAITKSSASTYLTVEFTTSSSLTNLSLLEGQDLVFTNTAGQQVAVNMTVLESNYSGTLIIDFSTAVSVGNMETLAGQQLGFVNTMSGSVVHVDFIIIETVIH